MSCGCQEVRGESLTEKVNSLSEAPTRSEKSVPPLCLKELHELALVWNHPQWVTRVLYCLKCTILKEALPLDAMRMTPKWDDQAQKPLLFNLSDDQKKDTTVWTEVVGTGDSAGDAPMDDSSGTPPPPGVVLEQLCGAHGGGFVAAGVVLRPLLQGALRVRLNFL